MLPESVDDACDFKDFMQTQRSFITDSYDLFLIKTKDDISLTAYITEHYTNKNSPYFRAEYFREHYYGTYYDKTKTNH